MSDSDNEDWDNFVASVVENSANTLTHPPPNTVSPNTSILPMSNHSSDIETQEWESFLASVPTPAVQWNTILDTIPRSPSDANAATASSSPTADRDEWDAFLAQVTSSPEALRRNPSAPVITSESEPPDSSSEHQPSSAEDEYRPSPVPDPVLYVPTSDSLPDDDDMQNVIGELFVTETRDVPKRSPKMICPLSQHSGAMP
jgi:hypothetical protein